MFHFGILVVIVGHGIGPVIRSRDSGRRFERVGYHVQAVTAGITTLAGVHPLGSSWRTRGPVFMATTVNDKVMYPCWWAAIAIADWVRRRWPGVVGAGVQLPRDLRRCGSVWVLQPRGDLMGRGSAVAQIHVLIGLAAVRVVAVHPAGTRVRSAICSAHHRSREQSYTRRRG